MKLLFITFSLLFSLSTYANTAVSWIDNLNLRAGLSFTRVDIKTDKLIDNSKSSANDREDEATTMGFGGFTSFSYRFEQWEFGVASDFVFGNVPDTTFESQGSSIRGNGSFRLVSVGPQFKFYTPYTLLNYANIYIGSGPTWSLQTYVFRHANTTGSFSDKRRVSFENIGAGLFIGLEQIQPHKTDYPLFIEVGYSYMHSYKVSILDASNSADVITLSEADSNDFSAQYVIIRMGTTLF